MSVASTPPVELPEVKTASPGPYRGSVRRVLVVANAFPDERRPYYGAYVHSDVQSLIELGLHVDVLYVPGYRGYREYVRGAVRSLRLNRRAGYDVVHAYHGLTAVVARFQMRMPLVVTFVGADILADCSPEGAARPSERLRAPALRGVAWLADATITRTEQMEQLLSPRRRHRNHVIPAGVDLTRFGRLSRAEARARLGWPPDAPTILFPSDPARLVKNFPLAQAAFELLRRRLPSARLEIAAKLPPDLIPAAMAAADAVLFTSYAEGSPNVIKEAMAEEVPIVSTPVGHVPELLGGVPGCHLCPPEPEPLAKALAAALELGRVPGARARVAPLARDRIARRIAGVYEEVLARKQGGRSLVHVG